MRRHERREEIVFGTVGHVRFDPANRDKLHEEMQDQACLDVKGYRWGSSSWTRTTRATA
jgi:hypothetical protein